MDSFLSKLLAGLAATVLCWLVAKYFNRSRLYCALSRLYEYSSLVEGSSTVQLVIANRGRKAEESVEVQLSTEYDYHLLASTQSGMEIQKEKTIRFPTLLPKTEVSLIFVAEGKPRFAKESVRHIRSKSAKGIVAASLTEAEAAAPGTLPAAISLFVLIAIVGYGIGSTVGESLWKLGSQHLWPIKSFSFSEGCVTVLSNGEEKPSKNEIGEDQLKQFAINAMSVKGVGLQGDRLIVTVAIENLIEGPIEYSIKLQSHASDSSIDWEFRGKNYVYDIVILDDGETREYTLSDYFPNQRRPKRFWLVERVEMFGYWVQLQRSYFFGSDSSMTCSSPDETPSKGSP